MDNKLVKTLPGYVFATRPFTSTEIPIPTAPSTQAIWGPNPAFQKQYVTNLQAGFTNCRALPWDNNGCIFTGLSKQSTLQVTVKYFIERIPTIRQPDLLVLARPPAPYDPVAMELYNRALSQLPCGVMVKENPLGEWFNDVLGAVVDYAPKIGQIFGTGGALIGNTVAKVAKSTLESRKKEQAKTKQSKPVTMGQNAASSRTPNYRRRRRGKAQAPKTGGG